MPKIGRKRKKTRTHVVEDEKQATSLVSSGPSPRSLCVQHGSNAVVEPELHDLVGDVRQLMAPATALKLKERKGAKIKDYGDMAPLLGVTHLLIFSMNTGANINLKIARVPAGPTLTFKVKQFTLSKHIRQVQKRPADTAGAIFRSPPVVVTNNFGGQDASAHVKLMRITFQNMFPAVDVGTVKLGEVRRVVLFNLVTTKDEATGETTEEVEVRHYAVRAAPTGINKSIKRIIQTKIPNLNGLNDIADYVMSNGHVAGDMSDSEAEEEGSQVVLPQKFVGKGNAAKQKSALKLQELGPRMKLNLHKVERGLAGGDVMYHAFIKKTEKEAKELKRKVVDAEDLKKKRKAEQEANVAAKKTKKDEKKVAKDQRRKDREVAAMDELRAGGAGLKEEEEDESSEEESSDEEVDMMEDQSEEEEEESGDEDDEEDDEGFDSD